MSRMPSPVRVASTCSICCAAPAAPRRSKARHSRALHIGLKFFMRLPSLLLLVCVFATKGAGQDTGQTMPRFDRYTRLQRQIAESVVNGGVIVTWAEDSKSFFYSLSGKNYKYDVEHHKAEATDQTPPPAPSNQNRRRQRGNGGPERGRQFTR